MNTFPILTYSEPPCDTLPDPPEVSRPCPQKTSHQAGGDQASVPPKRSLNILCIDDDEKVRQLLNDCLTHFKHRVMVASGGKDGVELFRTAMREKEPYEVVITDWGMPDIDGHHVAREIKAESSKTPVIMMTGWGTIMKEDGETAPEVDAVVGKPPNMQELNDLLLRIAG